MKKRILALLLCAFALCTAFAGCGKAEAPEEPVLSEQAKSKYTENIPDDFDGSDQRFISVYIDFAYEDFDVREYLHSGGGRESLRSDTQDYYYTKNKEIHELLNISKEPSGMRAGTSFFYDTPEEYLAAKAFLYSLAESALVESIDVRAEEPVQFFH